MDYFRNKFLPITQLSHSNNCETQLLSQLELKKKGGVRGWLFTCTEIIADIMGLMLCEARKCSVIVYLLSSLEGESPFAALCVDRALGPFKGLKWEGLQILKAYARSISSTLFKMYLIFERGIDLKKSSS